MRSLTQGRPQRPPGGGGGGGGGGDRVAYISLPALRPPVTETKPVPQPVVTPPVVVSPPPTVPDPPAKVDSTVSTAAATSAPVETGSDTAAGQGPGADSGNGGGTGGGNGPGTGPGTGPGVGGGEGGLGKPAEVQRLVPVPVDDRPKELLGHVVKVTFWIDAAGKVQRVTIAPEIRDRGYSKKFVEAMVNYRFRPARGPDGFPIPSTFTIDFTL